MNAADVVPQATRAFSRAHVLFVVLGAFFLTNAILAELMGGKFVSIADPSTRILWFLSPEFSVGVVLWPVVFITTDLINEYLGRRGVRILSIVAASMLAYCFVVIAAARSWPATPLSGVADEHFEAVFSASQWIIVGSIVAFLFSQFVDVYVFHKLRQMTGPKVLWLRATGSTVVSQLVDSVIVLYIGQALPNDWGMDRFISIAASKYVLKFVVAVGMTPVIYAVHEMVDRFLGQAEAEALMEQAAL